MARSGLRLRSWSWLRPGTGHRQRHRLRFRCRPGRAVRPRPAGTAWAGCAHPRTPVLPRAAPTGGAGPAGPARPVLRGAGVVAAPPAGGSAGSRRAGARVSRRAAGSAGRVRVRRRGCARDQPARRQPRQLLPHPGGYEPQRGRQQRQGPDERPRLLGDAVQRRGRGRLGARDGRRCRFRRRFGHPCRFRLGLRLLRFGFGLRLRGWRPEGGGVFFRFFLWKTVGRPTGPPTDGRTAVTRRHLRRHPREQLGGLGGGQRLVGDELVRLPLPARPLHTLLVQKPLVLELPLGLEERARTDFGLPGRLPQRFALIGTE